MTDKAKEAWAILTEPFHSGTRVTNCVRHSELNFDQRPDSCELCRADIKNHLGLTIRINEFLNSQVSRAKDALFAHLHP